LLLHTLEYTKNYNYVLHYTDRPLKLPIRYLMFSNGFEQVDDRPPPGTLIKDTLCMVVTITYHITYIRTDTLACCALCQACSSTFISDSIKQATSHHPSHPPVAAQTCPPDLRQVWPASLQSPQGCTLLLSHSHHKRPHPPPQNFLVGHHLQRDFNALVSYKKGKAHSRPKTCEGSSKWASKEDTARICSPPSSHT
jgi:hypothetical protein